MVVTCTQCEAKFRVDDSSVGTHGVKVKCANCQSIVIVKSLATTSAAAAPMPARSGDDFPPMPNTFEEEEETVPRRISNEPLFGAPGSFATNTDQDIPPKLAAPKLAPAPPPITARFASRPPPLSVASEGPPLAAPSPPAILSRDPFQFPGALTTLKEDSALSGLPHTDANPDEPTFTGSLSPEGTVTRPVLLKDMSAQAEAAHHPLAPQQLADLGGAGIDTKTREDSTSQSSAEHERLRAGHRKTKTLAMLGRVAIITLCAAGFSGELIVFRAGGIQGLLDSGRATSGAVFRRIALYPVLADDGSSFVVVRGDAINTGGSTLEIVVDGKVVGTTAAGSVLDSAALLLHGEVRSARANNTVLFRFAWQDTRALETLKKRVEVRARAQ